MYLCCQATGKIPGFIYAFLLSHETLSCENLGYHRQLSRYHAESQCWNQQMLLFALLGGGFLCMKGKLQCGSGL